MSILGKRLRLRAIERSDIPTFVRWLNDPEVIQHLLLYLPISQAQEESWFEAQLKDQDRRILGIETLDGKLIGNIALENINWKDRNAELGIVIGEKEYWGTGYGTEAIITLLDFAFSQMNLHRVYLRVFEDNQRALHCYEKCGFKPEGRLREAHFANGKYKDELVMGILRHEFVRAQGGGM
jgi:RimJ/RimL family protein N-acetyltransferase